MQLQHFWLNDHYWGQDRVNPAEHQEAVKIEKTHALNIMDTLLGLKQYHLHTVERQQDSREARRAAQVAAAPSKREARTSSPENETEVYLDNLFDIFSSDDVQ